MLSELFSAFIPKAQAEEQPAKDENDSTENKEVEGEEKEEEPTEEEEPEDPAVPIREECSETPECKPAKKHFEHCAEKVTSGKGFKGEDCVEELCKSRALSEAFGSISDALVFRFFPFHTLWVLWCRPSTVHLLHCVDTCAAPKVFAKLK